MSWYVYLRECTDGSIYTGIAIDVEARFQAHASGKGARYTRAHPPQRLLASVPQPDRAAASRTESQIKRLSAAQKRLLCSHGSLAHQSEAALNISASITD